MNILLLGTAYPWRGGIAHYTGLLAKYLRTRHTVDVVTFRRQYPKLLFPGKSQEESGSPGIELKTEMLVDSINPLNWIRTALQLRHRKYDVVIFKYWLPFFGPCFGTICHILKFQRPTIIIALCDNVIPHERRFGDKLFTRYAFSAVDGFLVQSQSVEKDLLSIIPKAQYKRVEHPIYEIFGNSIPKKDARSQLKLSDSKIILFFGYVRRYKGLDILLDAMKIVLQQMEIKLLVVGEFYDNEEFYINHAKELGIAKHVQFISNYLPNEQVAPYFCAADCLVLPYRSATQSGIVQIAYNFDKPVIITQVGGLTEVVKNNVSGFTVPPENPDELAKAILKFYNEDWETKLTEGVKIEKKRFSWQTLVDVIDELIQDLRKQK